MSANPDAPSNPKYKELKRSLKGSQYVEVFHMRYDTRKCTFEDLTRFFFTFHDPTTRNQQGNDKGEQYMSAIFYHSEE